MMQRIIFIIGIVTLNLLPSMAQDGQRLFDSEAYQARFQLAKRLNSQGHYIEAYDSLRVLHRDIIDVINKQGHTPATVTHTKERRNSGTSGTLGTLKKLPCFTAK